MSNTRSLGNFFQQYEKKKNLAARKNPPETVPISELIRMLDNVISVNDSNNGENKKLVHKVIKALLQEFENELDKKLTTWCDPAKPEMSFTLRQLEAITYLTGHSSRILTDKSTTPRYPAVKEFFKFDNFKEYRLNNFLNRDKPLKFVNFSRSLLTLQLALRIMDIKKIDQRDQEVCGPTSFIHALANSDPLMYVKCATQLLEDAEIKLQLTDNQDGLPIRFKNDNILKKETRLDDKDEDGDKIHEADFAVLVGLRECHNYFMSYSSSHSPFKKQLFGVTTQYEIADWMRLTGFINISLLPIKTVDDIILCSRSLKYKSEAVFLTTGDATKRYLRMEDANPSNIIPSKIAQVASGHYILMKNIEYLPDRDEVKTTIMTWGKTQSRIMPLKEFLAINGISTMVIAKSPQAEYNQRAYARYRTHELRIHPYEYCSQIRRNLQHLKGDPSCAIILKIIEDNAKIMTFPSWTAVAKHVQDRILAMKDEAEKEGNNIPVDLKTYLSHRIIDEDTIEKANNHLKLLLAPHIDVDSNTSISLGNIKFCKLNLIHLLNTPTTDKNKIILKLNSRNIGMKEIESILLSAYRLNDIDAACMLIEYYLYTNEITKLKSLVSEFKENNFFNVCDQIAFNHALYRALQNKIVDIIISDHRPDVSIYNQLKSLDRLIDNPTERIDYIYALRMLNHIRGITKENITTKAPEKLSSVFDNADQKAKVFICYSELSKTLLHQTQHLLFSLNYLNDKINPDDQYTTKINELKRNYNKIANQLIICLDRPDNSIIDLFKKIIKLQCDIIDRVIEISSKTEADNRHAIGALVTAFRSDLEQNILPTIMEAKNADTLVKCILECRVQLENISFIAMKALHSHLLTINRELITETYQGKMPGSESENARLFSDIFNFKTVSYEPTLLTSLSHFGPQPAASLLGSRLPKSSENRTEPSLPTGKK